MSNESFLKNAYAEIRDLIKVASNEEDVEKQNEIREGWLECIDHHDVEHIMGPLGKVADILSLIDKMAGEIDMSLRDPKLESRARRWIEVVGL